MSKCSSFLLWRCKKKSSEQLCIITGETKYDKIRRTVVRMAAYGNLFAKRIKLLKDLVSKKSKGGLS
jgi:hypothetical protein